MSGQRMRSWNDMNHEVLVEVMKRLTWHDRLNSACYVSKSWLSAVLDLMFPPGVIDLQPLDSPELVLRQRRYCSFLKHVIDSRPVNSWSTLYLAERTLLKPHKYLHIARRSVKDAFYAAVVMPTERLFPFDPDSMREPKTIYNSTISKECRSCLLQELIIPPALGPTYKFLVWPMHYWTKLKQIQVPGDLITHCPGSLQNVTSLRLLGVVCDNAAAVVRDHCPNLKHLKLISCALSMNALSTILDAHKNLELLDTQHSFRVWNCNVVNRIGADAEWNEEEIRHKATGVRVYRSCDRRTCAQCCAPVKFCTPNGWILYHDYI